MGGGGLKIYCKVCGRNVGTVIKATLMKDLVYICPKCLKEVNFINREDLSELPGKATFDEIIQQIFNPKENKK